MPLSAEGMGKKKAFMMGMLSGAVEPIGAALTILLAAFVRPLLPYFLSFAAGAMLYVVVEELIPEASEGEHSNIGTIGVCCGISDYDDPWMWLWGDKNHKSISEKHRVKSAGVIWKRKMENRSDIEKKYHLDG